MAAGNYEKSTILIFLFSSAIFFQILSGCATLGKDECFHADWFSIGYEDGAHGYHAARFENHRKACARHGVMPDFDTYEKGRQQGLDQWCTARNGNRIGLQGGGYNGVCPKELEPAFLEALDHGKAVNAYEKEYRNQHRALKDMYADLRGIEKNIADMETELVDNSSSPRRRKALLEEIRLRDEDRRLLHDDIEATEKTIADMRDNLEQMKARNPYK